MKALFFSKTIINLISFGARFLSVYLLSPRCRLQNRNQYRSVEIGKGRDVQARHIKSTLIVTMSRFTSLTSLWQDSTLFVSSCNCVRISQRATVVSSWRSPRCSSSSLALRFILITLTCFCRLSPHTITPAWISLIRTGERIDNIVEHTDTRRSRLELGP